MQTFTPPFVANAMAQIPNIDLGDISPLPPIPGITIPDLPSFSEIGGTLGDIIKAVPLPLPIPGSTVGDPGGILPDIDLGIPNPIDGITQSIGGAIDGFRSSVEQTVEDAKKLAVDWGIYIVLFAIILIGIAGLMAPGIARASKVVSDLKPI